MVPMLVGFAGAVGSQKALQRNVVVETYLAEFLGALLRKNVQHFHNLPRRVPLYLKQN